MTSSYRAQIQLGVTGASAIDAALQKLNKLNQALQNFGDKADLGRLFGGTKQVSTGFDNVTKSISSANAELREFGKLLTAQAATAKALAASTARLPQLPPARAGRTRLPSGDGGTGFRALPEAPRSTGNFQSILNRLAESTTSAERAARLLRATPENRITTDLAGRASSQRRLFEEVPVSKALADASKYFDPVFREIAKNFAEYQRQIRPTANDRRAVGPLAGQTSGEFRDFQAFARQNVRQSFTESRRALPGTSSIGALPEGLTGGGLARTAVVSRGRLEQFAPEIPAAQQTINVAARTISTSAQNFAQAVNDAAQTTQRAASAATTNGGGGGAPPGSPPGGGGGGGGGGRRPPIYSQGDFFDGDARAYSNQPAPDPYGNPSQRREAFQIATRQELTEVRIQAALERQATALQRSVEQRRAFSRFTAGAAGRVSQGIQGGLIGGAFPALFGQGPSTSLGGGVGGVLGGLIGGGGGSFAGGIVGSAVGKQLDDLATALKSPTQALDLLKTAGIELDDSTTSLVGELIDNNKLIEAQRVVYEGLNKTIGGDTVDEIIKADEAAQKLGKVTAELNRELITGLAPIMTKLIEYATGAARGLGPVIERLRSIMEFGAVNNTAAELKAGDIAGQRTQAKFGKMSTTIFGSAEAKAFYKNAFAAALENEKFNLRAAQGKGSPGPGLPRLDQNDRLKQEKAARDEAAKESKQAADEAAQRAKQLAEQQLNLDKQLFDNRLALAKAVYDKEIALVNFKFDLARKQQQQEERISAMQAPSSEARDVINAINDLRGAGREITDTLRGLRQEQQGLQRDLGAARSQAGMAGSMATREAAIQNNFQVAQGANAGAPSTLMGLPGIKEYLTGDKSSPGYRRDHGGGNYHEHIAFANKALRDVAMAALKAQGVRIGSVNDGRHAKNSYHYSDQAFDVPAAQVPVGREQALSARVRAIVAAAMGGPAGVVAGGGAAPGASPDQAGVVSAQGSVEQISAKLQGVTAQIQAYEAAANRIGQLNVEEFVLKLTQGFRDQAETLQNNTKELDRRSAALDNGVPMAAIDAEIKLTAINDVLIKKEEALDDQLKKGEISTERYAKAKTGLAAASRAAALASQDESAAISRNTGAQEAASLRNTGLDYDARLQALRDGRTELTEVEQLNLRILKGELTLAQAEAARLPVLAAINDQKKIQLTEAEKTLELYKSMDAVLVQGVGAAITGLIDKSTTLNDVLSDTLRSLGQMLINSALNSATAGMGGIFANLFKANGGPVSAGQPYFVGDNKDGSLNSTSELFIPGISGYVASSTDVQAAVRGAVSTPMDPETSGGMTVARAAMERSMMASEQNYQAAVLGEMANSPIKIESRGMRADELPFITMEESDRRTAEAVRQAVKISDAKWRQSTKNEVR